MFSAECDVVTGVAFAVPAWRHCFLGTEHRLRRVAARISHQDNLHARQRDHIWATVLPREGGDYLGDAPAHLGCGSRGNVGQVQDVHAALPTDDIRSFDPEPFLMG